MRNAPTFILAGVGLSLALALSALPARAESYSCNGDPMYARSLSGKTVMGARIRTQPCMDDSEIITVAPSGASLKILAEMDGWYKVQYGDTVGWMGSKLVQTGAPVAVEDKPVAVKAKAEVEVPNGIPQIIGISEKNFTYLKALNPTLVKRTKGKIVMRVQARGQLYYVTAKGPQLLEVKKLAELDAEDLTIAQIAKPVAASGTLKLNAETVSGKAILRWDANGVDAAQGFKLVVSEQANPVYPGNDYQYLSDPAARSFVWVGLEAGKTYHFRVCQYLGGSCGVYSNDVPVAVSGVVVQKSGAINLGAQLSGNAASLSWSLNGFESPSGFKVVAAEHAAPVYPGDDYHYLSDSAARNDKWTGLGAGKTYHFRVCEYLGGKCGIYSNEVVLKVEGQTSQGSISLTGAASGGKADLRWTLNGFESDMGFKVVRSTSPNPVYPGDEYHYLSDPKVRNDGWDGLASGQTYHFRVCEYLGGKCGIYSNDLPLMAP